MAKATDVVRVAHVSDLHLGEQASDDDDRFLRCLFSAMRRGKADHVVVSGDVTENGMGACVRALARVAADKGFDGRMTVVPGNHDRPCVRSLRSTFGATPLVRDLGPVRLVALDSSKDNLLPINASGRLSPASMKHLRSVLNDGRAHVDVVVLHHHVNECPNDNLVEDLGQRAKWFGPLESREEFLRLCADRFVEAVLTGHIHTPRRFSYRRGGHTVNCFISGATRDIERFRVLSFTKAGLKDAEWVDL